MFYHEDSPTTDISQHNLLMADGRRHAEYNTRRVETSHGKNKQSGHGSPRYKLPSYMLYMTWSRREA